MTGSKKKKSTFKCDGCKDKFVGKVILYNGKKYCDECINEKFATKASAKRCKDIYIA